MTIEQLEHFANSIKRGDKLEFTEDKYDEDGLPSKKTHIWTVTEKYKHHMVVERVLSNDARIVKSVLYKVYMVYGSKTKI